MAHSHGARAIVAAPAFDLEHDMQIPENRASWIQKALNIVQRMYADGIVFDYEEPQSAGSAAIQAYTELIAETRQVFQAVNPSYQISTCIPWSPDNIDGRNFPWLQLEAASDLLYVMDYDTRSQVFDACIASANAPYPGMVHGLQRFFDVGLNPQQLVLGVPWYGYRYQCSPGTAPDAVYCPIRKVPFRGVNCSDGEFLLGLFI
jgi:di-N-acetylchitobiase